MIISPVFVEKNGIFNDFNEQCRATSGRYLPFTNGHTTLYNQPFAAFFFDFNCHLIYFFFVVMIELLISSISQLFSDCWIFLPFRCFTVNCFFIPLFYQSQKIEASTVN